MESDPLTLEQAQSSEVPIAPKLAFKWGIPEFLQKRHSLMSFKKSGLTFTGGLLLGPLSLFQISWSSPRPASLALILSASGSDRLNSRAASVLSRVCHLSVSAGSISCGSRPWFAARSEFAL